MALPKINNNNYAPYKNNLFKIKFKIFKWIIILIAFIFNCFYFKSKKSDLILPNLLIFIILVFWFAIKI